eukprot:10183720-Prorocentrum_lima.AAC.1
MTSAYRVWNRSRRPELQRWQALNDRPFLAYTPGAGVADTVYRQGLQAELAASSNHSYGVVLWDRE